MELTTFLKIIWDTILVLLLALILLILHTVWIRLAKPVICSESETEMILVPVREPTPKATPRKRHQHRR
jgi:hypothetical protein